MLAQIVLFDGFDLLDVVAPFEVLTAGSLASNGKLEVELVSAEGARLVPSGISGVKLEASGSIDLERANLLILPGAAGKVNGEGNDSVPAILFRALETKLLDVLRLALGKPGLTVDNIQDKKQLKLNRATLATRPPNGTLTNGYRFDDSPIH